MSTSMEEIQSYRCRVCFTCIALPEDQISSILKGKHRVFVKCFNITVGDSSLYQNPDFSILGRTVNCSSCRSPLGYQALQLEISSIESPEVGQYVMLPDQVEPCLLRPASMEEIQSYRCRVCFTCIALPEDQISSILKGKHRVFVKCFNITVGDSSLYQNPDFSILGRTVNCSSCRSPLGYQALQLEISSIESPEIGQYVMLPDQVEPCLLRPASLP